MKNNLEVIGLGGTNGSGKDTVGAMLAERHGYLFVSVSDLLRDELKKRGLPPSRQHMRELSAEWRRESGLGMLVAKGYELYLTQKDKYSGVVMASLRNSGETDQIHHLNGKTIWVDADPRIRYERVQSRGGIRSIDDHKSFEEFLSEEDIEMTPSGDEATLNMTAVRDKSDLILFNDGNDINAFKDHAEEKLMLAGVITKRK